MRALRWGRYRSFVRVFTPPQLRVRRIASYDQSHARRSADCSWITLPKPASALKIFSRPLRNCATGWLLLAAAARSGTRSAVRLSSCISVFANELGPFGRRHPAGLVGAEGETLGAPASSDSPTTPRDGDVQRLRLSVFLTKRILVPGPNKVYILIVNGPTKVVLSTRPLYKDKTCCT
jgi:hypothetical protein